jgi:hypothetical protein
MSNAQPADEQFGTEHDDLELVSVVVQYDDGPDRCTIYHPDSTGLDRMSTWISADLSSFVDLSEAR